MPLNAFHSGEFSLLLKLPTELLDRVAQVLSPPALVTLCQVSKLFNGLCTRLIYCNVVLVSYEDMIKCCRTLTTRQSAALAVRKFCIDCPRCDFEPPVLFFRFYTMIASALKATTHLTHLSISAPQTADFSYILTSCHFSHLRSLEYALPASENPKLGKFLNRHPTIRNITIYPCFYLLPSPIYDIKSPVYLPNLESFVGPTNWLTILIPNSKVDSAGILWDNSNREDVESVVFALALSSCPVISVTSSWPGWNPRILAAFSRHLPDLLSLNIRNSSLILNSEESFGVSLATFVTEINEALPLLKSLRKLFLGMPRVTPRLLEESDLDYEFEMVNRWGEISSSLGHCTLLSGTTWLRPTPSVNVWLPHGEGRVNSRWLMMALLVGKYPPSLLNQVGLPDKPRVLHLTRDLQALLAEGLSPTDIVDAVVGKMEVNQS